MKRPERTHTQPRNQTDPVPEGKPLPVEPQDATVTDQEYHCTLSIDCKTILDNMDKCDKDKRELVPEDGWILVPTEVVFFEGESVFRDYSACIDDCRAFGIPTVVIHLPDDGFPLTEKGFDRLERIVLMKSGSLSLPRRLSLTRLTVTSPTASQPYLFSIGLSS